MKVNVRFSPRVFRGRWGTFVECGGWLWRGAWAEAWFYRTAAGAEIALVIQHGQKITAIEIKRSTAPKLPKGFHLGCADIGATTRFVVYPGEERFPLVKDVEAISLVELMAVLGEK